MSDVRDKKRRMLTTTVLDRYEPDAGSKRLGKGTYGIVYKATDKKTGNMVAIKQVDVNEENEQYYGFDSYSMREISVLQSVKDDNHENIIAFLDYEVLRTSTCRATFLVFECMDCDMQSYLENNDVLGRDDANFFMRQLLTGVEFLHSKSIAHRDLKPRNLLVNIASRQLKIADFGLSRSFLLPNRKYSLEIMTLGYRAPEILLGMKTYGLEVDMWSVGIIFVELRTRGTPLFDSRSEIEELFAICRMFGTPSKMTNCPLFSKETYPRMPRPIKSLLPVQYDPEELVFVHSMLEYDCTKRITAMSALQHQALI